MVNKNKYIVILHVSVELDKYGPTLDEAKKLIEARATQFLYPSGMKVKKSGVGAADDLSDEADAQLKCG